MAELRSMLRATEFGEVKLKLAEYIDKNGITRNKIADLSGIKYSIIDRYYKNNAVERVDLEILAKICYVLQCSLSDVLEYIPPNN